MEKRLIIIDSNALLHRSFHALPPLTKNLGRKQERFMDFC